MEFIVVRYFIHLAYKGTDFHGWQSQPNADSVQERIEKALYVLLKTQIEIVGCGRTDTGVHATQYYAHFDILNKINPLQTAYQLNALLPKTIVIRSIFEVSSNAHARFDVLTRTYQYHILLENNPFRLDTTWQLPHKKFDIPLMNQAAEMLLQHEDFQSFSKSKTDVTNYICNLTEAFWVQTENELVFTITANRFLRNMVRAVVGTLLAVGEHKIGLYEFENIITSKNRSNAGLSVPAQGLFLTQINYPFI